MNIVLISSLLIPKSVGGVEVLTVLLGRALQDLGHTVSIITGGHDRKRIQDGVVVYEIPELALPLKIKGLLMPFYEKKVRRSLGKLSLIHDADIIHAMDLDSILMLAGWEIISDRFLVTIQDYGTICANGLLLYGNNVCPAYCQQGFGFRCLDKRRISSIVKAYLHVAYRIRKFYRDTKLPYLRHVVCVSDFVAQSIRSYCPNATISVIGNCFSHDWVTSRNIKQGEKDIDILYVGRLESFKGIDIFLEAIRLYVNRHPFVQVYIVGGGNIREYEKRIHAYGLSRQVSFRFETEYCNMEQYYRRANIVVVPSVWPEPCGRVIIESMFWGCAVVSTNRGGTQSLIEDGKTGILINSGDSKEILSAIELLMTDKKKRLYLQQHAAKIVMNRFHPYRIASCYESVYKEIAGKML